MNNIPNNFNCVLSHLNPDDNNILLEMYYFVIFVDTHPVIISGYWERSDHST